MLPEILKYCRTRSSPRHFGATRLHNAVVFLMLVRMRHWFPARPALPVVAATAAAFLVSLVGCGPAGPESRSELRLPPIPAPEIAVEPGPTNPAANSDATFGGEFTTWIGGYPKSLNYWLDANSATARIAGLLFEPLAGLHPTDDEPVGALAESWEIADDAMSFTFRIHPAATWSDGKPVTAHDIQFYYDTMMNPANPTSVFRVSLARLKRPEIVDERTVHIEAVEQHWSAFWDAAGLIAFPRHAWENLDFKDINKEFPVVSGPYEIANLQENRSLTLARRPDWWGRALSINRHQHNFDYIRFRFIEDRYKALEALKKGEYDLYPIYTAAIWARQTRFEAVEKGWVARQEVFNSDPKAFQGFAMNLRRPRFQDLRVRKALSHLLNREQLLEKIMFNQYFLLNSYFPDLFENNRNPDAPFFEYNADKARALLTDAGWIPNDRGILEKDGEEFSLVFLHSGEQLPHFNIYMEDLKKVGIDGRVEYVDQATHARRVDEHAFDMVWANWGAGRLRDPEAQWHSKTADEPATYNLPGFRNAEVDALIEEQKTELDLTKRNAILRRIDAILTAEVPYVLLWQSDRHRLLYWNRFGTPPSVLGKFGNEDAAAAYWWLDAENAAELDGALRANTPLPQLPEEIRVSL